VSRTPAAPEPGGARRQPVTRDRALDAAVALADSGGIDSLSMRKLAAELGIEAMSLYYHVRSKEDLLDGMVDRVFGEMAPPSPGAGWRSALQSRAEATRGALARHPWSIPLLDSRTSPGIATLRHVDAMVGVLLAAGFSMSMAGHALSIVDSYVRGFAMQEASLPLSPGGSIDEATHDILEQQNMMSNAFPHLARMAAELILQPGYAYGNEFEFGLRLILDGLEVAHRDEQARGEVKETR
jgi:AcrR family transcriptional regulator